jgi:hypothetical protein
MRREIEESSSSGSDTLPKDVDVLIVGAGHAGLAMAGFLGQAGREHLVIDRRLVAFERRVEQVRPRDLHVDDERLQATVIPRPVVQVNREESLLLAPLKHVPPPRAGHVLPKVLRQLAIPVRSAPRLHARRAWDSSRRSC